MRKLQTSFALVLSLEQARDHLPHCEDHGGKGLEEREKKKEKKEEKHEHILFSLFDYDFLAIGSEAAEAFCDILQRRRQTEKTEDSKALVIF